MTQNRSNNISTHQLDFGNDWESCIYNLFNPENHAVGEEFFDTTILNLNKYISADYVLITRVNEVANSLESVSFCDKEKLLNPISFEIQGTICERVLKQNCPTFINNVQDQFNVSEYFKGKNIKTYIAVPLYGATREPIGILTALFRNKINNAKYIESLMFMFSSRIGSEIEHLEKERELKRRNLELLVFKEELIKKNKELDQINQELKETTLKAEESNMLKTSFLANLSHEIRTPMNAIIGFTELLKSNNLSAEEKKEYLDIVHQNGNQLLRVMDALIDISKLQAKAYTESKKKISINTLFSELYPAFAHEISVLQKPIGLKLYFDAEEGNDILCTYKDALKKILDHIVGNAIKFTHEGEIELGYQIFDNYFEFFVKDTGVGIPEGQEERIFDLFRQADINQTREFEGNGIGLSIVRKYTEVMGGSVWAESKCFNGSLFKFRIPRFAD